MITGHKSEASFLRYIKMLKKVPSWGIEPQPKEPESSILSIKLRGLYETNSRSGHKYNAYLINDVYLKLKNLKNESICFSRTGISIYRDGT